jgi:hypothetical protein
MKWFSGKFFNLKSLMLMLSRPVFLFSPFSKNLGFQIYFTAQSGQRKEVATGSKMATGTQPQTA